AALLTICGIFFSLSFRKTEEEKAMESVIRLHIRAADDSNEEQALKLKVRDEILNCTTDLLQNCTEKSEAQATLQSHLPLLQEAGQRVVCSEGKDHSVTVALARETFEYREYDGFFLPEGEYDSLIVTIGSGEGHNWWCVVFPAACYMGAAEMETNEKEMPSCFRLATKPAENVTVKFWLWEKIKGLFD
ncbi:MAG: stage II sporulation protein R, partial [Clostridia bacterium]|nr:stage II sporulation protein R [Clostridia bacterium]